MEREVYVLGAGGHAKVVVSTLQDAGYRVKGLLDDDPGKEGRDVLGIAVLGSTDRLRHLGTARAVIAVGENAARKALAERFEAVEWASVVHPTAYVHPSVQIGGGTVVFAGAIVQPGGIIGSHCIINTAASVDHDCVLGDYVHIGPGTCLAGDVQLGEGVFLGIGSAAIPGVRIGDWSVVGAGGVITRDLTKGVLAVGVPARPMRRAKSL